MNEWPAGLAWRNHFRKSLLEEQVAGARDEWGPGEREILGRSLAQFQLGESSDGRHLLRFAREFGDRSGDSWLAEAMALFIQEENRHSAWLGEFLRAQNYPLLRTCWIDGVFRALRKPMGFGLMTGVLVCAEIVAVPYYTAVREVTRSTWLRRICSRLLRDEAVHLRFQASNLGAIWRHWRGMPALLWCHRAMMGAICLAVWAEHGDVLRRGGYTRLTFLSRCLDLLAEVHTAALTAQRHIDGGAGGWSNGGLGRRRFAA